MEPILNEQQAMLRESAVRLCRDLGGPKRARQLRGEGMDSDRAAWDEIAKAGWLSTAVPEASGGMGMGLFDLSLVCLCWSPCCLCLLSPMLSSRWKAS